MKGDYIMLLRDQMKEYPFSNTERIIVDFILEKNENIRNYSTNKIAKETYTSPSLLVRIANKLGFNGWSEFKEAYLKEVDYLNNHFVNLNANIPFQANDTIMSISRKISKLHSESIDDTLSLIEHDSLQKAVSLVNRASKIQLFAVSNMNFLAMNFAFKLQRIGIDARCDAVSENMFQNAHMMQQNECAILLSYSGQTVAMLKVANILKSKKIPFLSITSIGNNDLSKLSDVVLHVSTREKSYSKIGPFSSEASFCLILDCLYSCLFSLKYNQNWEYKVNTARAIETGRVISNPIIDEEKK